MMIVSFLLPDGSTVDYDFVGARVPVQGELVVAAGDDPEFPSGSYEVGRPVFVVGLRGPQKALCPLSRVGTDLPAAVESLLKAKGH